MNFEIVDTPTRPTRSKWDDLFNAAAVLSEDKRLKVSLEQWGCRIDSFRSTATREAKQRGLFVSVSVIDGFAYVSVKPRGEEVA